ncbi:multidrug transporter [Orrella marina]|uniref:Multidrug transporter n=1 Tax=Orrella marina TaxID=2163011 RepID=A0A2R4XF28_9BURK|nr:multidrug transporter [Orrella marina]
MPRLQTARSTLASAEPGFTARHGMSARASNVELALQARPGTLLWRLSLPNVLSNLLITLVTIADAWFVGRLGGAALASLALVFPFQSLMQMFGNGAVGGGIASAISRSLGAGDAPRASVLAWHALLIAGTLSLVFMLVFVLFARPIFMLMGATGPSLDGAVTYAAIAFGASTASWLFFSMFAICRGCADMRTPARVLLVSTVAQAILSGCLTLGIAGTSFDGIGVLGPAVAIVLCQGLAGLALLLHARGGHLPIRIAPHRFDWSAIRAIMRVGGLGMINSLTIVMSIVVVTGLIGQFGDQALGGYGLGSRLELMLVPIAFGIGGALTTAVGINIGAGQHPRARHLARFGSLVALAIIAPIGIVLAIWPQLWLGAFTQDPSVSEYGASYLRIVGPLFGVFVAGQVLYFASQGTGFMRIPVAIGVLRFLIVTSLGSLSLAAGFGLTGIFTAVSLGMLTIGVGMWASTCGPAWRKP